MHHKNILKLKTIYNLYYQDKTMNYIDKFGLRFLKSELWYLKNIGFYFLSYLYIILLKL